MKLAIERAALLRALTHVQSVVERRNTIPILSNVRLEGRDGRLKLTATDMDLEVVEEVEAHIGAEGGTTAPAHLLHDIVRKLPEGGEVGMETADEGGRMVVRCGRSRFTLPCLPTEDFPVMAEGEFSHEFQISAVDLRRLIDKTRFAISTEETRYYLNGIYLHVIEGDGSARLCAVATDGHRLARVENELPQGADGMPGVIVPRKTVGELRKLIDEGDGAVAVALSRTKVRFAFGSVRLTSKLIDGTFPDYGRVIPTQNDKVLEIEGKRFAEAVDRVATISTEKSRTVKLALEAGRLRLSANSPDSGSAAEELDVGYAGPSLEIGFNSRYLLDMTAQAEGRVVEFAMADAGSPTLMRDSGDPGTLYVLMPMRV
ncbi:MAG: DNA polymerase III subunit beta [Alphaproteobacteria bacterium]|nr:DNA polymerase III subunit beta [Alphaproteobacteria bacterium]